MSDRPQAPTDVVVDHVGTASVCGMTCSWAGATHVGNVRRVNEDSLLVRPGLFVVADGMGGHAAGDVASRLTVDAFSTWAATEVPPPLASLGDVVTAANRSVHTESLRSGQEGMGSTLAGVAIADNGGRAALVVFHVGDSRCYTVDGDGRLVQLTRDHSQVQEMVDAGEITADEARHHRLRNVVTRAIGIEDQVMADFLVVPGAAARRLLLCSDGVSGEIDPEELERLVVEHEQPAAACAAILGSVLHGRAMDNATVIVVDVVDHAVDADVEATGPRQRARHADDLDVTGPRPSVTPTEQPVAPSVPLPPLLAPPTTVAPGELPPPAADVPPTPLIEAVPAGPLIELVPHVAIIPQTSTSSAPTADLIDEVP